MNVLEWLTRLWQSTNTQQKTNIIVVAAIFVAVFILIFTWASRPDYKPLYTNLSSKDASAITKKLVEDKIPYKLENDGNTISVPQRYLYETRLKLAGAGLPESGEIGFEIFDKMNLQTSEFIEGINYVRALQGELAKTITSISDVRSARVMLNIPKESIYMEDEAAPTASVVLSLGGSKSLSPETIQAIAYLVASSVKKLKPDNVTIVDEKGNLLYSPDFAGGSGTGSTNLSMQRNFQRELEGKVQNMLDRIFGVGKSMIKVSVEMEFDKQTIEKETYEPTAKDEGIIRSMQENVEVYNENQNISSPAQQPSNQKPKPGTTPKPGQSSLGQAAMASGVKPQYDQKSIVKNYEINKSREQKIVAPGKVKRITAGVFLDKTIPLDDKGIQSINEVLESSIGINKARGDIIKIRSLAFNNDYWKEQQVAMKAEEQKQSVYSIIKMASPAAAVVLFIIFYLVMLRRLPKTKPAPQQPARPQLALREPQAGGIGRLQPPSLGEMPASGGGMFPREAESEEDMIKKMAIEDPGKIAKLLEKIASESE